MVEPDNICCTEALDTFRSSLTKGSIGVKTVKPTTPTAEHSARNQIGGTNLVVAEPSPGLAACCSVFVADEREGVLIDLCLRKTCLNEIAGGLHCDTTALPGDVRFAIESR